jgi:hypothetical protein
MARSVEITTPIPSLEEVGESLGLSKRRRNTLISLFRDNGSMLNLARSRNGSAAGRLPHRAMKSAAEKAAKKAA